MQTAIGVLFRAAVAVGAILTLTFGEGHGVGIDPRQHLGVGRTVCDRAEVILAQENVDVGPVPSVAADQGRGRHQTAGISLQTGLHRGVIRIPRGHAGQQGQSADRAAQVIGKEGRVAEKLTDQIGAGIGENQRGFRAGVRGGGRVITHDRHGDVHIGGGARTPAFDSQGAGSGLLGIPDRRAQGLAAITGKDRHGTAARRHGAENHIIDRQHGAPRSARHGDEELAAQRGHEPLLAHVVGVEVDPPAQPGRPEIVGLSVDGVAVNIGFERGNRARRGEIGIRRIGLRQCRKREQQSQPDRGTSSAGRDEEFHGGRHIRLNCGANGHAETPPRK